MKLRNTSTIHQGPIRVVIFGKNGVGKTRSVKTLRGKTLVLSLEDGLRSLQDAAVDFYDLTRDDNDLPFKTANEKFQATISVLKSPILSEYDNVVLDSLTQFGELIKSYIEETEAAAAEKNKYHIWNRISVITTGLINFIKDHSKANFIFLATEEQQEDDEKRTFYFPNYPGKASMDAILSLNDEIWRLTVDKTGQRLLILQPDSRSYAKSRGSCNGLLAPIEPCDLGAVFEKIKTNTNEKEVTK